MRITIAQDRIPECIEIRRKVFVEEQGVPWELEVDGFDEPDSPCEHFLMLDGDTPFGTFRAYFETEDTVHLQRFCILKEYRGRGFGREAMEFIRNYYRDKAARITFGAQCTAIPFYEKCGCKCVSDVFLDAGLPHRIMEKVI